jgi:hypothetical protein
MASSASSSASSGDKSIAVLIKKAMAKMPMSYNTKKSIDEYYKTAMKAINDKKKAEEKAKKATLKAKEKAKKAALKAKEKAVAKPKAVKGSKTVKKPRAKKLVGGMTKQEELDIIESIIKKFIYYNNMLVDWQQDYKKKGYIEDIKELVRLIDSIGYDETNIYISNENILKSVKDDTEMDKIYRAIDDKVVFLIEKIIDRDHPETHDYYTELYNSKKTPS